MAAIQVGTLPQYQLAPKFMLAPYQQSLVDMLTQHNAITHKFTANMGHMAYARFAKTYFNQEEPMKKYYRRKRRGFHFVSDHLRYEPLTKTPADGKWLRLPPGSTRPRCCRSGFHASPKARHAEAYRPQAALWLCYVEVQHVTDAQVADKFTGRARKIIARMTVERYDYITSKAYREGMGHKRFHAALDRAVRREFKRIMKGGRSIE